MSRVFTRPARAARAKTITIVRGTARELIGIGAQPVPQAQLPHEENGAGDAARLPAPGRGRDPRAQAGWRGNALHRLAEGHVLHQRDRRETREIRAAHEDRLVAGGDAGEARAPVHAEPDQRKPRIARIDGHVEAAPGARRQRREHLAIRLRRQERVCMQKQQGIPRRDGRAGVHLLRAAAQRRDHPVAVPPCKLRRAIRAAAVRHDHLVAARAQGRQRAQAAFDAGGLVQGRNDDAQPRIHAWNFSTYPSSRCGACAFFHTPAAYLFASASVG
jgi:hypothetical protein